jgi:hypothetical protein
MMKMMSSTIITLISIIIPGLGLMLMGKWKSAIMTWISLAIFIIFIPLTSQLQPGCFILNLSFAAVVWIWQLNRARNIATINTQINNGEVDLLNKVNEDINLVDNKLSYSQGKLALLKKTLEAALKPGESILAVIPGATNLRRWMQGDRTVCLGLLENDILVYEFGIMDIPDTVRRIPISNAKLTYNATSEKLFYWIVYSEMEKKKSLFFNVDLEYKQNFDDFVGLSKAQPLFR